MRTISRGFAVVAATALALGAAACSPPSSSSGTATSSGAVNAATATTADAFGGMDALVKAAQKEGTLNVIALPPDWANYGAVIGAFGKKYNIKVVSAQPDASSQAEINAAKQLKGQPTAPDVFDVSQAIANSNTALFAPYKVATWAEVPDNLKDPAGTWANDYGGYMSVGYDAKAVPAVTSLADLMKPAFKGKVALNGDPTAAGAAFAGVMMASLANGGSADNIAPGVDYFVKLKKAGNFLPVDPDPATIEQGQTPVVLDWDYLNVAQAKKLAGKRDWKTVVPAGAVYGGYYVQAINKGAPHPAAARLWQEFLYSDAGQNLWLAGGARPVRADAMVKAGTIDATAYSALPKAEGTPVILTQAQQTAAASYLAANWAKQMG